jgi:hypothetical protein
MSTIKIRHSTTAGAAPASLSDGELAINGLDEVFFYRRSDGVVRSFGLPAAPIDLLAQAGLQINGAMEIDQARNGVVSGNLTNGTTGVATVADMTKFQYNHTANTAVFVVQQVTTGGAAPLGPNLGFAAQAKSNTAFASPNSGDFAAFLHHIEGLRMSRLAWGTALARAITIGFWVNSTVTGTGSVAIRNSALNRSYVANFTVTAANTWQWVTVTIPGDIIGTWLATTGIGLSVIICFGCGTNFQTTAGAWQAGNFLGTSSNTNFFGTNANVVQITGLIVLPGNNLPSVARSGLLYRSLADELSLCQRYFYAYRGYNYAAYEVGTGAVVQTISFPTTMRAAPTASVVGSVSASNASVGSSNGQANSKDSFILHMVVTVTGGGQIVASSSAGFNFDARL